MATIKAKFVFDDNTYIIANIDNQQKVQKNFTVEEVANNKAKDDIKYVSTPRHRKFLGMIQEMRDRFGSMQVNSCYRTKSFNSSVGGDTKSRHLDGEALDWWIGKAKLTDSKFNSIRNAWEEICIAHGEYGAINHYTNGVHLEIGSDKSYGSKTFQVREYRKTGADW